MLACASAHEPALQLLTLPTVRQEAIRVRCIHVRELHKQVSDHAMSGLAHAR